MREKSGLDKPTSQCSYFRRCPDFHWDLIDVTGFPFAGFSAVFIAPWSIFSCVEAKVDQHAEPMYENILAHVLLAGQTACIADMVVNHVRFVFLQFWLVYCPLLGRRFVIITMHFRELRGKHQGHQFLAMLFVNLKTHRG